MQVPAQKRHCKREAVPKQRKLCDLFGVNHSAQPGKAGNGCREPGSPIASQYIRFHSLCRPSRHGLCIKTLAPQSDHRLCGAFVFSARKIEYQKSFCGKCATRRGKWNVSRTRISCSSWTRESGENPGYVSG